MMWSMVVREDMAVESKRLALMYFTGFMKRRRAPQKVSAMPIKASIDDEYRMDEISAIVPKSRSAYPLFPEGLCLYFHNSSLNASFSLSSCWIFLIRAGSLVSGSVGSGFLTLVMEDYLLVLNIRVAIIAITNVVF